MKKCCYWAVAMCIAVFGAGQNRTDRDQQAIGNNSRHAQVPFGTIMITKDAYFFVNAQSTLTAVNASTAQFTVVNPQGIPYRVTAEQYTLRLEEALDCDSDGYNCEAIPTDPGLLFVLVCLNGWAGDKETPACEKLTPGQKYTMGMNMQPGIMYLKHGNRQSLYLHWKNCATQGQYVGHCVFKAEVNNPLYGFWTKGVPLRKLPNEAPWPR